MSQLYIPKQRALNYIKKLIKRYKLHRPKWFGVLDQIWPEELCIDHLRYGIHLVRMYRFIDKHSRFRGPLLWGYIIIRNNDNWYFYTADFMPKSTVWDYNKYSDLKRDVMKYEVVMRELGYTILVSKSVIPMLIGYSSRAKISFLYRCFGDLCTIITRDRISELYDQALMSNGAAYMPSSFSKLFNIPHYEIVFSYSGSIFEYRTRILEDISKHLVYPSEGGRCSVCGSKVGEDAVQFVLYYNFRNIRKFIRSGRIHERCFDRIARSLNITKRLPT